MTSLRKCFQCKPFEVYLSNPVSFKEGLELLFTQDPGNQILYQMLNGELKRIKRGYENRFVQDTCRLIKGSIDFSVSRTFLNWAPETIKNGFYLEAEVVFERPLTVGKAIDLMVSGEFVKLKNLKTGSIQYLKLYKDEHHYYHWINNNGSSEPVSYETLPLSVLLDCEFFEVIKIDGQEETT